MGLREVSVEFEKKYETIFIYCDQCELFMSTITATPTVI